MTRFSLVVMTCLFATAPVYAGETTMTTRELAETELLAQWVGVPEKQYILGNAYYHGDSVKQDYAEAAKWYRLSADQGWAESQHMLGVIYDHGDGVPPDYVQAVAWYRAAAEQGYAPAQFELGNKYASGEGVTQNFADAYIWFSLAAATGHEQARVERDEYASKLSHAEIMDAQQRASKMFEQIKQQNTKQ